MSFHVAQVNIAIAKFEYNDPAFAGFVDNLDRINSLADDSSGFVWRYTSDDDDAEAKRVFKNGGILFNMSLWESVEQLRQFVYKTDHVDILRQRADWFDNQPGPSMALWWQPANSLPTVTEAKHRLECLGAVGPGADAFTFRNIIEPPATAGST